MFEGLGNNANIVHGRFWRVLGSWPECLIRVGERTAWPESLEAMRAGIARMPVLIAPGTSGLQTSTSRRDLAS
jgi:hypothetical protein